ncbi:hypothetical protein [Mesorhizobium sp. WSM2239]|uniref:Uncharacterized protein n=2 Tax=unclassified Mesorhizobium TaxID=325217 RepID=A0AAU8DEX4_9HYPH
MANWYGTCRSNYVHVKNPTAFANWIDQFEAKLIEKDGRFGFYSENEYGDLPTLWEHPETFEELDEPMSILDKIHEHLVENEVLVVMEAGAEKVRYVSGWALAIHSSGERVELHLHDIYKLAQDEFGGDAQITEATY